MASYTGLMSHADAEKYEISQLSASGCGVTALLNVLVALSVVNLNEAQRIDWSHCILRSRKNDAPLPEYLLSRSVAGCTGQDLVSSMEILITRNNLILGGSNISSRFISYTEILASGKTLHTFVEDSLREGKCLVATLNLQLLGNDAWHHQMIYAVDKKLRTIPDASTAVVDASNDLEGPMIYCVNPVCAYPVTLVEKMLSTQSILRIRSEDILKRLGSPNGDTCIYQRPDWVEKRVEVQIESLVNHQVAGSDTEHTCVIIPANYIGGLAIFELRS
jgi:hypothetical protein